MRVAIVTKECAQRIGRPELAGRFVRVYEDTGGNTVWRKDEPIAHDLSIGPENSQADLVIPEWLDKLVG